MQELFNKLKMEADKAEKEKEKKKKAFIKKAKEKGLSDERIEYICNYIESTVDEVISDLFNKRKE